MSTVIPDGSRPTLRDLEAVVEDRYGDMAGGTGVNRGA